MRGSDCETVMAVSRAPPPVVHLLGQHENALIYSCRLWMKAVRSEPQRAMLILNPLFGNPCLSVEFVREFTTAAGRIELELPGIVPALDRCHARHGTQEMGFGL